VKHLYVWLASASSTVGHSLDKGLTRTGCGIDIVGRGHRGVVIDGRLLNERVRLCRVCWKAFALPRLRWRIEGGESVLLPPCEEDNP
jgi:hypothetical protein